MEEKLNSTLKDHEEVSLKDIFTEVQKWVNYIKSKWMFILISILIGGLLGICYSLVKKTIYTATTTFVLEEGEKSGGLGQYAGLASMVGLDLGGGGGGIFQGDNILELYRSRTMIEKTLLTEVNYNGKNVLLVDLYIDFNNLRQKWQKKSQLKDISFSLNITDSAKIDIIRGRVRDSVLRDIVKDINRRYLNVSKPDKKLSIINIEVNSDNEFFAKSFDDAIVKNVNDFYIQTKTKKSLANVKILERKTDSVRTVMNSAIYSGAAVLDATPNLNITRQTQRMAPMQKSQFNVETNKAVLGELIKNLELSRISLLKETPLIQVVDKPVLPLEEHSYGALKWFIIGAVLIGFMVVFGLTLRRFIKQTMRV